MPILEWNKFYVFSLYISVKNFEAKMGKIADFDYSANNTFKSKDPNKTKNRSLKL